MDNEHTQVKLVAYQRTPKLRQKKITKSGQVAVMLREN
jgi:hypothetical protein